MLNEDFNFDEYDCIGFDLDNALALYNVHEMVSLEYNLLAKYLVEVKNYDGKYLLKPVGDDIDFFQKGLFLDINRGNILKLGVDGLVLQACHGTSSLGEQQILQIYGQDKCWDTGKHFLDQIIESWNGPASKQVRAMLDYFDMPCSLIYGRLVDTIDEEAGKSLEEYNIWPDVLQGLYHMFSREHFQSGIGGYFSELKSNPNKYLRKHTTDVTSWLKQLKSKKFVFLVTGSHIDYASFTASYILGPEWKDLFNVIICFARKPFFFTATRPFYNLEDICEVNKCHELVEGVAYSQGNWSELREFIKEKFHIESPKCLYVGDNLIQDIYTPMMYSGFDTVVVCEELAAECDSHPSQNMLVSKYWGSYFHNNKTESLWNHFITKYGKICVPDVGFLVQDKDIKYKAFTSEDKYSGYYPYQPIM